MLVNNVVKIICICVHNYLLVLQIMLDMHDLYFHHWILLVCYPRIGCMNLMCRHVYLFKLYYIFSNKSTKYLNPTVVKFLKFIL